MSKQQDIPQSELDRIEKEAEQVEIWKEIQKHIESQCGDVVIGYMVKKYRVERINTLEFCQCDDQCRGRHLETCYRTYKDKLAALSNPESLQP